MGLVLFSALPSLGLLRQKKNKTLTYSIVKCIDQEKLLKESLSDGENCCKLLQVWQTRLSTAGQGDSFSAIKSWCTWQTL